MSEGAGSDVDRLVGEVAQVVAAIERAKADTHGAAEAAKTTTMRAAASGYASIAQQMHAVQQQFTQVAGVLDGAAAEARRAGVVVRAVSDRMSSDQVASRLASAAEQINAMRGTLYGAVQRLANVSSHVRAALRGGQPGPLLGRIDAIRQVITIAAQRGDAARNAIQGAAAHARRLGTGQPVTGPAGAPAGQPGTPGTAGSRGEPRAGPPGAWGEAGDADGGAVPDGSQQREQQAGGLGAVATRPTGPRGGRPTGQPHPVARDEDEKNQRDYRLERQTAQILADQGYRVHQRPDAGMVAAARVATGDTGNPNKNPDYLVEGRVFDGYSPRGSTRARNVHREAGKKVGRGQTQRVVINLQEWVGDLGAMRQQFADWPIPGMREVKAITSDLRIIDLWPPAKG